MTKHTEFNKRSFTLLEVVIAIALIALMAGFGTWSLTDLLAQHRRQAEVEDLKNFLVELQIEALALQTDLEITISKEKEIVKVSSKTAEKILRDRTVVLKGVEKLTINHQELANQKFQIFSTGRFSPNALIGIERKQASLWIDLRLPIQIKFTAAEPKMPRAEEIPRKPKKEI
jgi:prepilin-type N-terminal cleavage/methylation domain-containing protein